MSRRDTPAGRVVPAGKAAPLRIGRAVLGQMETRDDEGSRGGFRNHQRLAEIERLIAYRIGIDYDAPGTVWTDDETYLRAALPTLLFAMREPNCPAHRSSMDAWIAAHLPSLIEAPRWWLDELLGEFTSYPRPKPRRADGIARDLNVTWEEHETLDFRQISFVGGTPEVKAEIRRIKAKARMQRARRERGAIDRETYVAGSVAAVSRAAGISRTTHYRRQKKPDVTGPFANETGVTGPFANADVTGPFAVSTVGTGRGERTCSTCQDPRQDHPAEKSLAGPAARPGARPARATDSPPPPTIEERDKLRVPVPAMLPSQPADAVQLSILPGPQADAEMQAACGDWESGPLPEAIRVAYVAAKRRRAMRQEDIASAIGISRPQLANALQWTFNLSPEAIERLKAWLLTPDADLPPPAAEMGSDRPARPHHRRGGKRPPADATLPLLSLRLFSLIEGGADGRQDANAPDAGEAAA